MSNRTTARRWRWVACGTAVVSLAALVTGSVVASSTAAPVNTKAPVIMGSPIVGKDLNGNKGTWTGAAIT